MLKFFIFYSLVISGNALNFLLLPEIICDELHWTASQVIFAFFDTQAFLTIIDFNTGLPHSLYAISCEQAHYFRSINVYDSIESFDVEPVIETSGLSSFPTTEGYFIRTNLEDFTTGVVKKISYVNPKSFVLFNIPDATLEESKAFLRFGYETYKMLNVAALCYMPKFDGDRLLGVDITLCMYNPFHEEYPETRCIVFNSHNQNESIREMNEFRKKRVENLQGFKLNIDIFEYEMKSVAVRDENGSISHYTYPDGELLNSIAKYMNFTPVYVVNTDGEDYGYQDSNGNFTGSLGALEYEKADLVANPRFIADYNTEKSLFLQPITMTKLFFTIKKRETIRKISFNVIFKLDITSKIIFLATVWAFPMSYYIIHRIEYRVMKQRHQKSFIETILYMFALLCSVSMKHTKLGASRMVLAMVFFFVLITSSLLQGTILNDIKTMITVGKISKIEQLYENDFKIAMQPALTYVFQGQIEHSVNILLSPEDAVEIMRDDPKLAYLLIDLLTGSYLDRFYDQVTGENLFEVVPDEAFQFYIAMMAPKASPLIERFNEVINLYVQTGLYDYHTKKANDDNERIWIQRIKSGMIPKGMNPTLNIYDFVNCFKIYFSLNAIALVVFLVEYVTGH